MLIRMVPHQSRSTTLFPVSSAPQPFAHICGQIPVGYTISIPNLNIAVTVAQEFLVYLTLRNNNYQVTSAIAYVYEFGDTPGQAITRYLEAVAETFVWLHQNEASLSTSVHHELVCLQQYFRII